MSALCDSDTIITGVDNHNKDCCPHNVSGKATTFSTNVLINGKGALRMGDKGTHSTCCGSNTWEIVGGNPSILINGMPAARTGDLVKFCDGNGGTTTLTAVGSSVLG